MLVRESAQDYRRNNWMSTLQRCGELYAGNHYPITKDNELGRLRMVLNRIPAAVMTNMALQAATPPKILLVPRETGEPPEYYLDPQAIQSFPPELQRQANASTPLDPIEAKKLKDLIQMGKAFAMLAQQTGQPAPQVIPENALIEITDAVVTDVRQTVFDGMWEDCDAQTAFVENVLHKNIYGCQPTLCEFDDVNKSHILKNTEPTQVFYQPTTADIRRTPYAVYDQFITLQEAIAKYPKFAASLSTAAHQGPIQSPGHEGYIPVYMFKQQFYSDMVLIRTAWIRNQPYAMSEEEALTGGHVTEDISNDNISVNQGAVASVGGAGSGVDGSVDNNSGESGGVSSSKPEESMVSASDGDTGKVLSPDASDGVIPRRLLRSGNANDVVTPPDAAGKLTHQQWPMKMGLRQITILLYTTDASTSLIEDKQSEFCDIPIANNVNIPIPFSPLGIGEPMMLEDLQLALNRVLSDLVTHHAYNAVPPEMILKSIADSLDSDVLRRARTKPNQRMIIDDSLLDNVKERDLKNILYTAETPPISPDSWKLLTTLVELFEKQGNMVQVAQGDAEPGWSGEAIQSLQNAHNAVVMAKSQRTESYLKYLARLMLYDQLMRMQPSDWARYCRKYPIAALNAIHARAMRAMNNGLDPEISVQIASGTGAAKNSETQNLIAARAAGIPISRPTIMERMDLDPETENQREMQFIKDQQEAAGPIVQQQAAQPATNNPPAQAAQ